MNRTNDTMHSILHNTIELPSHTAFLSSLSFLSMIPLEYVTNNALSLPISSKYNYNYNASNASFNPASPVASTIA